MDKGCMLTTLDNPFDPFTDFASWYMYDCEKGHNTYSRIARIAQIDGEMTEKEIEDELDRAMNLVIRHDFEEKFVKVWENQPKPAENMDVSH